jgi:protein-S-isoprenylcysteine O-methyltransferase Ste14
VVVSVLRHLPIVAIAAIGLIGATRAALLYRRGVRVVVIDRERSRGDFALELSLFLLFLLWMYLIIDYATGQGPWWTPVPLDKPLLAPWPLGVQWFGAMLLATGVLLYALATISMGNSWRIGIDRDAHEHPDLPHPAALVTTGIFAWSRNPIYLGFDLVLIGAFAIHGRMILLMAAVVLEFLLHVQALREERLLAAWYGAQFEDYRRRVGRYGPWERLLRQSSFER